ncbi:hypothetical protein [Veronia nyctiphanis]|nr:hypothetical protein [Veronia nyctiphanis]
MDTSLSLHISRLDLRQSGHSNMLSDLDIQPNLVGLVVSLVLERQ